MPTDYELTDRANSIAKYDFFLKNIGAGTTVEKEVENTLKRKAQVRVLDLGCGEAQALKALKEKYGKKVFVAGVDQLPVEGLDEFSQGAAQDEPYPSDLDLVFSFRSMHEFSPLKKVVEKIGQSLAKGGKAFLSIRCQQLVGGQLFFHGNLNKEDLSFLKKIGEEGVFEGLKVEAKEAAEKKQVLILDPAKGSKIPAELKIVLGIGLFLKKT